MSCIRCSSRSKTAAVHFCCRAIGIELANFVLPLAGHGRLCICVLC